MAEDGVGGEVVGGVHKVRVGRGCFAGPADSRFCVGDDAAAKVDEIGAKERRKREDDRRSITTGVCDQAGVGDGGAVEFREP